LAIALKIGKFILNFMTFIFFLDRLPDSDFAGLCKVGEDAARRG
jgi:hypothetical protein